MAGFADKDSEVWKPKHQAGRLSRDLRQFVKAQAIVLALLFGAPGGFSQQLSPEWRFWTQSDGLAESCIRSVGSGPDGRIWLRHGAVDAMAVLDGYGIVRLPEMRAGSIIDWGLRARAYGGRNGEGWAVEAGELRRFVSGRWIAEVADTDAPGILVAVPAGSHGVLVLFADRLALYQPTGRIWKVIKRQKETQLGDFLQVVPGFSEDFWITGTTGIARLELPDGAGAGQWTERDTLGIGMREIGYPNPSGGQELFFSGRVAGGSRWAVARWNARELKIVHTSRQDNVTGWRGPDGEIWILDGAALFRLIGGKRQPVIRSDALSGTIYDVLTEPGGGFWLATSEGLAHYSPPIWRTPLEVADLDAPVHSVMEDRQGRLWFAATEYLLELDGTVWRRFPLPYGVRSHTLRAHGLGLLPDGRITLSVRRGDSDESVLLFDPVRGSFQPLAHPAGSNVGFMRQRNDRTLWVVAKPGYRLEIYDGKEFRTVVDLTPSWKGDDIRCLLETGGGTLWVGGPGGAAVWRNGVLHMLGPADGFTETGAFEFAEFPPGEVLVGGRDKLLRFDGRRWSELRSGLDRVRTITTSRDGVLWVASGTGLDRRQQGEWIGNGEEEGLPSNTAYTVFQDSRGRVWAGSSRGLSLYHPEADRGAPRVGFAAAGNTLQATPQGDIRILLAGTDRWKFTRPYRLLYSYALDSGGWTPFAPQASATYHGLAPGSHQLRLRGMDRNGNVQPASGAFEFTVVPPWYRQTGFILISAAGALIILALVLLAAADYRQRGRLILDLDLARLAAESASHHKSRFLANMSHEIRTPMNAVMGMTELALEKAADSDQKECLETVQKSANSLLALLNDILDFTKVEAGKMDLAVVDFEVEEAVRDVLRTLDVRAGEKGLELGLQVAPGVPRFVAGDDQRLRQVLLNLVGNAIKFTMSGEIRVLVRLKSGEIQPATLEFVVADTGVGVRPEKQEAIFAPFEQADDSTTRKYGGTGLGLAICSKLVEMMHGRIWIESPWLDAESGRTMAGSAFHFTAQFAPGKAPARAEPVNAGPAPENLRVLLAEDNAVNRTLAVRVLDRRGHTVLVAENGCQVLEILARERVDVILMDIQMPEMDGFQATAAIREKEKISGGHLPIVALTANAMRGDGERCLAQGMDAYLAKPFRIADLDRVLGEVTGPRHAGCRGRACGTHATCPAPTLAASAGPCTG
jgi:signal transduction histidine kinase/CheY-like chemotaxis protein